MTEDPVVLSRANYDFWNEKVLQLRAERDRLEQDLAFFKSSRPQREGDVVSDAGLELAAQLADTQLLRRALAQLVETCRVHCHGSQALEPALLFAEAALDDTSHEGWMRRMREHHEAVMVERYDDCRRNGRHLETRWSSDEPPQCTHCERLLNPNTPDGL